MITRRWIAYGASCLFALSLITGVFAATSPKTMTLRLSDLKAGYTVDSARFWNNTQAAHRDHVPVGLYSIIMGRVTSYDVTFTREAFFGILYIDNTVREFLSDDGARKSFAYLVGQERHTSWHSMSFDSVGNDHVALMEHVKHKGFSYTFYTVIFRRDNYVADITIAGLQGGMTDPQQLVALAQLVDWRIVRR